ncbi:MarR family transcriptional regulator [uncultured Eubacterium sp.]|uniref:MarR family winged helix-turn-helix transcriptional regulator n=1 Tax=uncultured Eubacterium sp. TaxID=165185 RepID=UPI0025CDBA5A|nr:MarR family transcriptional regulator [uncultured Eubacterium sp.]
MEEKENKEQKNEKNDSDFSDCRNHFKCRGQMEHMEQNVWEALHMFRKLNIGSILPHLNKGEFVLMNGIYHVQKKIGSKHGVKMSELAEYTHALPPAVSRTIKALEEKGYVRRFVDQKDRRNTLVEITEAGQEALKESNDIMNEFVRRVFEKTDKEEMARLVTYIYQQYDLAKEELEKIREGQKKEEERKSRK